MDLKNQVISIVNTIENPPDVNEDGEIVAELPNYAQTEEGEWVVDFDRVVDNAPAEDSNYSYDADDDTWQDMTTGETWSDFWWTWDNRLILGGTIDDNVHPMSGMDYLSDILDIEFIVANNRKDCLGARILVTFGGPNIWINTRTNQVEGYWWSERHIESFTDMIGLAEAVEELWGLE